MKQLQQQNDFIIWKTSKKSQLKTVKTDSFIPMSIWFNGSD